MRVIKKQVNKYIIHYYGIKAFSNGDVQKFSFEPITTYKAVNEKTFTKFVKPLLQDRDVTPILQKIEVVPETYMMDCKTFLQNAKLIKD